MDGSNIDGGEMDGSIMNGWKFVKELENFDIGICNIGNA